MMKLRIEDLHCEACARRITRAIQMEDPGARVAIDVPAKEVEVESAASPERLLARLAEVGYPAVVQA
jgi:copper chaperone